MTSKFSLFDGDAADGVDGSNAGLVVNEDYSKKYSTWRRKEEMSKLKSKFGDVGLEDSSSDESIIDDFDSETEREFLRTYSLLKRKDPRIYDPGFEAFSREIKSVKECSAAKPFTLREAEIKFAMDGNPEEDDGLRYPEKSVVGDYDRQLAAAKAAFKKHDDSIDCDGDFLRVKPKTNEEKEEEEELYRVWLRGRDVAIEDPSIVRDMDYLRSYWNNPDLGEKDACLKDFVLDRPYRNFEADSRMSSSSDEDDRDHTEADMFERKFNFRFEEPDPEFIKQYPRTIAHSVRKKSEKRKEKRVDRKERKDKEKEKFRQEIKRLKAMKRKELEDRLSKLRLIAGDEQFGLGIADLDKDEFDGADYDRMMNQVFNDQYYEKKELVGDRPSVVVDGCEDLDEVEVSTLHGEFDPTLDQSYVEESVRSRRKRRRERKRAQRKAEQRDLADDLSEFEEDFVGGGGVGCSRFKYRKVLPNDYGLDYDELLFADDRELNQWSSLKKCVQYKSDQAEILEKRNFEMKRGNVRKKQKILKSLFEQDGKDDDDGKEVVSAVDNKEVSAIPDDARLRALGLNPRKLKRKLVYGGSNKSKD